MSGWSQHGSASAHRRYKQPVNPRSRRRCHCGCKQRATHLGMANGVALTTGCELYVRRWVRNWRDTIRRTDSVVKDTKMSERIELSLDGSHACALLGPNLQEGEAEFVAIEDWPRATYKQEHAAMLAAYEALASRLGKRLPYDVVIAHCSMPNESAIEGFCYYAELRGEKQRCLRTCERNAPASTATKR